jgi:cytidylate kinase
MPWEFALNNTSVVIVAVDGPAASGKSTVSRRVAHTLGFTYVDSGSFYRGIAWKCLRDGVDTRKVEAVSDLLKRLRMKLDVTDGAVRYRINGESPGEVIRSQTVQENVSDVAAMPDVRAFITARLRETTQFGSVVMEGRDIGTVVFPDTPFKYFLDADPAERARRRNAEMQSHGNGSVEQTLMALQRRDTKDSTRPVAPLQRAANARIIDSTSLSIDDVTRLIVDDVQTRLHK